MSTKKSQDFKRLVQGGYGFNNVVAFFLRDSGCTMTDIARRVGKSRQFVHQVIDGNRSSEMVIAAVKDIIGFDPWDRNHG